MMNLNSPIFDKVRSKPVAEEVRPAVEPGCDHPPFGYTPIFLIMGCLHIIGLATFHLLAGKMKRVSI
jgi:hypothetical protein